MLAAELRDDGQTCVLRIQGSLDALTVRALQKEVETRLGGGVKRLLLDMTGLAFIDSSGVGAVVAAYKQARAHRMELNVQGLAGQPMEIFRLLRLDSVLGASGSTRGTEP